VSLASELRADGLEAEPIPGGKGQFDVIDDGTLVFSKHELGRFPEDGEVKTLLAARGRDG
jgi:predicted Rdx family selenoprotein